MLFSFIFLSLKLLKKKKKTYFRALTWEGVDHEFKEKRFLKTQESLPQIN
jgi:hypothetical protein